MTERDLLASSDKRIIDSILSRQASPRKARLFACACYRSAWPVLDRQGLDCELISRAIELAERIADHYSCRQERDALVQIASACQPTAPGACQGALRIARTLVDEDILIVVGNSIYYGLTFGLPLVPGSRRALQCRLLRDIFGNSVQRVPFNPDWVSRAVLGLAHTAYEERSLPNGNLNTATLAVLADALEDAGCDETIILSHLRTPGIHLRGCWAVDTILGLN